MAKAYLGLGGNIGDTRAYFTQAIEKLKAIGSILAISSLYQTEPVDYTDQSLFLNAALELETTFSPELLLLKLKSIEKEVGRTETFKNGPREIDIDILLYDEILTQTDTLTIPHSHLHERAFALVPLSEIAPHRTHPVFKKTISNLASRIGTKSVCKKLPPENTFPF